MKPFYGICSPDDYEYARFGCVGTWVSKHDGGVCDECGMTDEKRVPPLVIEWEPDSDIIGDFSWGGFDWEVVARLEIANELTKQFSGFQPLPLEMSESKTRVCRAVHPRKPRVSLPYEGPELCELWISS